LLAQAGGKRTPEQMRAAYNAHKGEFDYLLGDWDFTSVNREYGKGRGFWSAVRLAGGQILDEYRLVGDAGETYYVTTTLRAYNAVADRWELVGMDQGNGLQDREGRSDVLELFEQRGIAVELHGLDRLIAACAIGDAAAVRAIGEREPRLVGQVVAMGGELLAKFAGTGNPPGVRQLLDLGVDVEAPFTKGDGYFGEPPGSLAIHVAAWRARPAIVKLLIERGSPVDVPDANGRTPLALAVRACVDSYWTELRSPGAVEALLRAGASVGGVPFPSGYAEVEELLRRHGATS
jgi:hypothetical protein